MQKEVYEFVSKQTNDPIIEWRTCKRNGKEFAIFQGDQDLLKKISPKIGEKIHELPLPTLNPEARRRRRLMRRNDRKLYKTTCKITNKPIITFYHPDIEKNIVEHTERYKSIDNTECAQDFDFNKTFHEQFDELMSKTYKKNILTVGLMQNSDYTHNVGDMKNCYMVFDTGMGEESLYCVRTSRSKYIVDGLEIHRSENVYDSVSIHNSRNMYYSQDCYDCSYSAFIYNCRGCHNCICCSKLVNQNYYIFNKKVSKKEYKKMRAELFDGRRTSIEKFKKMYDKILKDTIRKNLNITNCENSIGHNITNGRNIFLCEENIGGENIRYCDRMLMDSKIEDCMDISSRGFNMNHCYELNCCGSDNKTTASNCHFGSYLFRGVNSTQYSVNIPSVSDYLFGCSEIDNKKYHIFNKSYLEKDYITLSNKIIEHMKTTGERGEFFAPEYSPFPYNDTIANDYYPIHTLIYEDGTSKVINAKGIGTLTVHEPEKTISTATLDLGGEVKIKTKRRTSEQEVDIPEGMETLNAKDFPDNIDDVTDDVVEKAILCIKSGRPYRIIKQELDFYRKHKLPVPLLHPDLRHLGRLSRTVFFDLHLRTCDNCNIEIISVYPADSEHKVHCEACYNKEVYG